MQLFVMTTPKQYSTVIVFLITQIVNGLYTSKAGLDVVAEMNVASGTEMKGLGH